MQAEDFVGHVCEGCGASNFTINHEGFTVCTQCGIVIDTENFEYSINRSSIDFDRKQSKMHHPNSAGYCTQIGNIFERNSSKLKKLQTYQDSTAKSFKDKVKISINREIARMCSQIGISKNIQKSIVAETLKIYDSLPKYSGLRNPTLLSAVAIYACKRFLNYSVSLNDIYNSLIPISGCFGNSLKSKFKNAYIKLFPLFKSINAEGIVFNLITQFATKLNAKLQKKVVGISKRFYFSNKSYFECKTPQLAAATSVVFSMAVLNKLNSKIMKEIANNTKIIGGSHAIESMIRTILAKNNLNHQIEFSQWNKYFRKNIEHLTGSIYKEISGKYKSLISLIESGCKDLQLDNNIKAKAIEILQNNSESLLQTTQKVAAAVTLLLAVFSENNQGRLNQNCKLINISSALGVSNSAVSKNTFKILIKRGIYFPKGLRIYQIPQYIPDLFNKITISNIKKISNASPIQLELNIDLKNPQIDYKMHNNQNINNTSKHNNNSKKNINKKDKDIKIKKENTIMYTKKKVKFKIKSNLKLNSILDKSKNLIYYNENTSYFLHHFMKNFHYHSYYKFHFKTSSGKLKNLYLDSS
ncbi:MAG: hypothetical protein ACTSRZ_17685 [Promethearchaeota archaeon]